MDNDECDKRINMSKKRKATLRNDGRWMVYAKLEGKRVACYGRTEYSANLKADYLEGDSDVKERLDSLKGKYDFENCFYRYRNYQLFYGAIEPQTIDRYEATYSRYYKNSFFSKLDVRTLNNKDIEIFIVKILNKYNRLTTKEYQRIIHIIKSVLNFVYDEELEDDQLPIIDWKKIRRKLPKGKVYTSYKKEYAVSNNTKSDLRKKIVDEVIYPEKYAQTILLLINFSLGLRIGELASLKIKDVDFERKIVYVHTSRKRYYQRDKYGNKLNYCIYEDGNTKTPKGVREIPMSETVQYLFELLKKYRKEKGYRSQYWAYDGRYVKDRAASLTDALSKICNKSEIEYFHSHIIRKSFATALSKCPDIDIATISEYMGHAQVSTTLNNYLIPEKDTLDEKIQKISGYI